MAYRRTPEIEAHLASNREKILEAARALVSEGGWPAAQIIPIAAAVGLATGTIYRYFPSKAELYVEVLARVSQREIDMLDAIAGGTEPAPRRLQMAITTFVTRAMRTRRLAYALFVEPCEGEIDQARLQFRQSVSRQFLRIVKDGQRAGQFRSDAEPELAATIIVGGMMEALTGPLSPLSVDGESGPGPSPDAIRVLANAIADLCKAAVVRQPLSAGGGLSSGMLASTGRR